jgi:hypothetical protein
MVVSVWDVMMNAGPREPVRLTRGSTVPDDCAELADNFMSLLLALTGCRVSLGSRT